MSDISTDHQLARLQPQNCVTESAGSCDALQHAYDGVWWPQVAELHAENMNLGVKAADGGLAARQDLAKIQLVLEQQYRSTLSDAEARMKEDLYTEMSGNQKELVRTPGRCRRRQGRTKRWELHVDLCTLAVFTCTLMQSPGATWEPNCRCCRHEL